VRLTGLTGVEPLSESCPISPVGTGLTGGAHRSDRCWSVDSRFGVPLRSQVGRVCVLVPRSSGTPVATWARPTWVVSRRRVLEAMFILLEFTSPSRRIFISSHSLPPVWFAVSVLQVVSEPVRVFIDSNQSKIQGWRTRNGVRVLHTSMARTTRCGVSGWVDQERGSGPPRKGSDPLGCHGEHRLCPADGLPRSRIEGPIRRQQ
jgi:hypothetical protein